MALTSKTYEQTCLIEIRRGDLVKEKLHEQREGKVVDFRLVPNGINDSSLVCLVVVELKNGGRICSCSKNWRPVPSKYYLECYPSLLLNLDANLPAQQVTPYDSIPTEIGNPITSLELIELTNL